MTYFPDLGTETQITAGPTVRAVGWLSSVHPYIQGGAPAGLVEKLRSLCTADRAAEVLGWPAAAGSHLCEICGSFRSSGNCGIPGEQVLYVVPEMIVHYVEVHEYLPPEEFVQAVLASPAGDSGEYVEAVRRVARPQAE
jgi:hypothetical protein